MSKKDKLISSMLLGITQEDKELLISDLCSRLPYGVILSVVNYNSLELQHPVLTPYTIGSAINLLDKEGISLKPFLRVLSDMTDEEEKEYHKIVDGFLNFENAPRVVDWLNAHHFDYRGLIEKGLALRAPDDMYKD